VTDRVVERAFDWIGSVAVADRGGLVWLEDGKAADGVYVGTPHGW
jgi:hypothetical protein